MGRKLALALAVLGILPLPANAAIVSPDDAAGHIGESATVCGAVASAKFAAGSRSQPTFLDVGKPYPQLSLYCSDLRG
jgi:hypothetical protein